MNDKSDKEHINDELMEEIKKKSQYYPNGQLKRSKIGRNEPCPCGSNKKFKKCCIDKV